MKHILRIIKKEMDKVFKDPRAVFGTFIFPGLMIFIIYGSMGAIMAGASSEVSSHESNVKAVAISDSFYSYANNEEIRTQFGVISIEKFDKASFTPLDKEFYEHQLETGAIDLLVIFDENFETATKIDKAKIEIYANQAKDDSKEAYLRFSNILESYRAYKFQTILEEINVYDINYVEKGTVQGIAGRSLSMLIPMLIVTFVMSGALSVCADSFAGEKERGTLATLMMTPVRRWEMVTGKVVSNTIIAFLSALSSFIGVVASLPNLSTGMNIPEGMNYSFGSYLMIFLIIISISLMSVAVLSVISCLSRTVKEASTYSTPIYLVGIVAALIPGFSSGMPTSLLPYFIPIYNCSLGIKGVLTFDLSAIEFTIVVVSNLSYFAIVCYFLAKLFKKETVLFGK